MKAIRPSVLFLAVALVALLVQEFAVRLALPDFNPNNHLRFKAAVGSQPVLGPRGGQFRLVKNSGDYNVGVSFNRHGLRDSKDITTATADDVIVVGDSFAFGWGVEEKQRLSEQLAHLTGRKTFNVATPSDVPGYGKLLDYAKSLGADTRNVALIFNMYDDINDYTATAAPEQAEAAPKDPTQWNFRAVKEFLLSNSSLYFLTTSLITQSDWLRRIALKAGLIAPLSAMAKRTVDDLSINSTIEHLERITRGYNAIIVLVPNRGIWIGDNQAHEREIHQRFIDALKKTDLAFVDMRPIQEKDGNPMGYHFVNDGHWRALGHRLGAAAIAAKMTFPTPVVNQ